MKELIPQFIAMAVSAFIFMNLSIKFGWSKKIWSVLNKKINPMYSSTIWILFAAFLHISIQWVCVALGIVNTKLITGALIGCYFATIPNLGTKKNEKK